MQFRRWRQQCDSVRWQGEVRPAAMQEGELGLAQRFGFALRGILTQRA